VFNCGIGMVVAVAAADAGAALDELERLGERAWHIGNTVARRPGDAQTIVT
jgi:phosphoribosylformylglycinamidine cyclo-ligase